jgi:hypothetical protein
MYAWWAKRVALALLWMGLAFVMARLFVFSWHQFLGGTWS